MKTVIEMAREAGDDEWKILIKQVMKHFPSEFHRFAELVRADEREACAKVLDEMAEDMEREMEPSTAIAYVRSKAATIRARGETK